MNLSSYSYNDDESEPGKLNIELEDSNKVNVPRVKLSPAHFECELYKIVELPSDSKGNPNHLIIGNIIGININDIHFQNFFYQTNLTQVCQLGCNYLLEQ